MIPSVFVNAELRLIVNWRLTGNAEFQEELIPEYASFELVEEYRDVLTVMRNFYDKRFSFGLELDAGSFREIAERRLYLSGDSLGTAWLLGAMCCFFARPFPTGVLAWGALKPIRNGGFALFETGGTDMKTRTAVERGYSMIVVHEDEAIPEFNGEVVRLSGDLLCDLKILERVIYGRP